VRLDVPVEEMWAAWRAAYGPAMEEFSSGGDWRDFEREAHT
jgi:hypothetical protein